MQYERHGWKYPVDTRLDVKHVGPDGWAMGKTLPLLGPVMMLRIHYREVHDGDTHLATHYHYEVVIGAGSDNPIARLVNARLSAEFGPAFFAAWQQHNVMEVGTFEKFLPVLFTQKEDVSALSYPCAQDPAPEGAQPGHDRALFDARVAGFAEASDLCEVQAFDQPSFL